MMLDLINTLHGAAMVGTGIMAGLFFVFTNFAMQSLAGLPHPMGMKAMQAVNENILNPIFLSLFFATGILPVLIVFTVGKEILNHDSLELSDGLLFTASAVYFLGCFLVTAVKNVPMNKRLAEYEETDRKSVNYWQFYLKHWTAWNHVRTVTSIAAFVLYTAAYICR